MTKNTRNSRVGGTRHRRKTPKNPNPHYQPMYYLRGKIVTGLGLFFSDPKNYKFLLILTSVVAVAIYNHDLILPLTGAAFTAAKTYLFRGIK